MTAPETSPLEHGGTSAPRRPPGGAIDVRGLSKAFDHLRAVSQVDLALAPGEIVGLVGVNGAGKTTLLRMLAGILQADEGHIAIGGHVMGPDAVEARRRLAFVPDTPNLFESLTVLEHLLFIAEVYGVPEPQPAIDALLDEFELTDKCHATAASLSRGMRQKVTICCAFLHRPEVLLLDEPLTGLDPLGRKNMRDAISARAGAGAAVLISSHQLEVVEQLSHRFVILHAGEVRLSGTREEVLARQDSLEDIFLRATDERGTQGDPASSDAG